jgi:nucleoside-diphosphate-sugar epimerase
MKRVLITGGGGFVGSHVTRRLLAGGCDVAVLASPKSDLWRLADVAARVTVLRSDLAAAVPDLGALTDWRPDTCLHLAWYAEPGKCLTADVNVPLLAGSLRLLDALIKAGCGQVVMAGTCAEYDADVGYFHEDSPTKPLTTYAASKLALGLVARQVAAAAGIRLAWARLFLLYGRYEDERRVVPAVIRALLHGRPFPATLGEQVRDYLHVEDVAAAFCALASQRADGVFNICSGEPLTVRRLMETVGELVGRTELIRLGDVPYRAWDPPFLCGDNAKIRGLGWSRRHDLRSGLRDAIEWWRGRPA